MLHADGRGTRLEFVNVKIHPLFFISIIFCAVFGGLPSSLLCLLTALLHESGHIFCAAKMGFCCREIKIMPYGAAAVCDIDGIRPKEEVRLALAGPAVNAAVCLFLAALWWFIPESYAYTDTVMQSNFAMLAVNLLPCYPLDGGRVFGCLLNKFFSKKTSRIVLKVIAVCVAAVFIALYFFTVKNPSLPFFGIFLLFSAIEKAPMPSRISYSLKNKLKRGIEVKEVLCDGDLTYLKAFSLLEENKFLILKLYAGGRVCASVTQTELLFAAESKSIYEKVFQDYLSRNDLSKIPPPKLPESADITQVLPKDSASSTAPSKEE